MAFPLKTTVPLKVLAPLTCISSGWLVLVGEVYAEFVSIVGPLNVALPLL